MTERSEVTIDIATSELRSEMSGAGRLPKAGGR